MEKIIKISNKVYSLELHICPDYMFVCCYSIDPEFRGRKYSYRIFDRLLTKYKKSIILECYYTLLTYYTKLGFSILEQPDNQGYYTMVKEVKQ